MMDPNASFLRKVGLTVRIRLAPAGSQVRTRPRCSATCLPASHAPAPPRKISSSVRLPSPAGLQSPRLATVPAAMRVAVYAVVIAGFMWRFQWCFGEAVASFSYKPTVYNSKSGKRRGSDRCRRINANQSISSIIASIRLIASLGARSAVIPCSRSSSDSRDTNASVRTGGNRANRVLDQRRNLWEKQSGSAKRVWR